MTVNAFVFHQPFIYVIIYVICLGLLLAGDDSLLEGTTTPLAKFTRGTTAVPSTSVKENGSVISREGKPFVNFHTMSSPLFATCVYVST